jgi:hypothetical protein
MCHLPGNCVSVTRDDTGAISQMFLELLRNTFMESV